MRTFFRRCLPLLVLAATGAHAQSYPAKPVRVVVGYTAGGSTDVAARLVGQKLSEALGQQFVVDNRPGASANIAAAYVAKAPPDGYTVFLSATTSLASGLSIFKQLPYDPRRDFAPVVQVTNQPHVLVVHPSVTARTVKEFIALAKAHPGKLNSASATPGGPQHMAGMLFTTVTGAEMTHVHYKGGSPAINDLVGGQLDLMFAVVPEVAQFIQMGRLRPLAVTTPKRAAMLPDVPTMHEAGVPRYEFRSWHGLAVPAGTPRDIVVKLNTAVNQALQTADLRNRFSEIGLEVAGGTIEDFQAFINREIELYAKLVKVSGMPLQ